MSCGFRLYRKDHVIDQTPSTPLYCGYIVVCEIFPINPITCRRWQDTARRWGAVDAHDCWNNLFYKRVFTWLHSASLVVGFSCFIFFVLADPPSSGLQMGPSKLFHSFWNLTLAEKLYVINQICFLRKKKCLGVQWESWIATTISKYIIQKKIITNLKTVHF